MLPACIARIWRARPENPVLQRTVDVLLEGGLDLALETDRARVIRRDVVFGMNLAPRLVEGGEDQAQRLGKGRRGVLIVGGQPGQAAVPGGSRARAARYAFSA